MHGRRQQSSILIDQQVGSRVRMRRLMLKLSHRWPRPDLSTSSEFFETASPHPPTVAQDQSLTNLNDFMATRDGLTLAKAFMRIGDTKLRRRIVDLVEEIERHQD